MNLRILDDFIFLRPCSQCKVHSAHDIYGIWHEAMDSELEILTRFEKALYNLASIWQNGLQNYIFVLQKSMILGPVEPENPKK